MPVKNQFTFYMRALFLIFTLLALSNQTFSQTQPAFSCMNGVSYLFVGYSGSVGGGSDNKTSVYQVNVVTGASSQIHGQLLPDATSGGNTSINNVGYNVTDNYLWGFRIGTNQVARIGSDFSVQTFAITGLPNTVPYNAGDIDANGILYLFYGVSSGSSAALQRVDLNPASANYLKLLSPITLSPVNSNRYIIDLAINPVDGLLYGLDGDDNHVYRINPTTGVVTDLGATTIGNVGATAFGAVYFDLAGTLYVSQNTYGGIYRIPNVATGGHTSAFLAQGPITVSNDGARCPLAPIPTVTLSGTVFDDANGLLGTPVNTVDGTPVSTLAGNTLYANLVGPSGVVVSSTPLTSGTYSFTGVGVNASYTVVVSNVAGTPASAPPSTALTGVENTGEHIGTGAGNDGLPPDGAITVATGTSNITNINFGLDVAPVVLAATDTPRPNPGGSATSPVSATVFRGSYAEDGTYPTNLTGRTVTLSPATNGTVYYNGTAVNASTVITGFNPTLVSVNPTSNTNGNVTFPYAVNDNAGIPSDPKIVTVPFTAFSVSISGTVFDDANGLTDNIVNGTGVSTLAGNTLYANLVGPAGTVVASTVLSSGSYSFTGVTTSTSYTVVLSNSPGTVGSAPPGTALTGGVVNTGENIGTGAGNDGLPANGRITVAVATGSISSVNFGINVRPVVLVATDTPRPNPGGTTTSPVSATVFSGTDTEDGTYPANLTGRTVTLTPATNGTLYYNGTAITSTTAITSFDPTKVTIDPTATGATTGNNPTFTYAVNDNAGVTSTLQTVTVPFTAACALAATLTVSPNICISAAITLSASTTGATGTVNYTFTGPLGFSVVTTASSVSIASAILAAAGTYTVVATDASGCSATATATVTVVNCVSISGTVFDDANGLVDGFVNGTAVSGLAGNAFSVNLVGADGQVAATTTLTNGLYSFTGVKASTSYSVVLSNAPGSIGSPPPSTTLTGGVVHTGENIGLGAGSDGSANGVISVSVVTGNGTNVNFGVNQLPAADPKTVASQINPGGTTSVTVPTLTGSDPEDGAYTGTSNTLIIQALPTSATLRYDGLVLIAGQVIPDYEPNLLTVDPADGPISVTFTYSERDAAGQASPPALVTMPFIVVPDLTLILYARPSTVYGTTNMTVVVDVFELNSVATTGVITIKIPKDPRVTLSLNPTVLSVNGHSVQNSAWTFSGPSGGFYTLTTTQVIAGNIGTGVLSVGLDGVLTPGATQGTLTVSAITVNGSGGDSRIDNNNDADKVDYFQN